ncbi:MAG: hypothetical protein Q8P80_01890 [Candidatus Levybacteria bacterium]|nr:hypothetical protein [Candidatus Levybacteria bacterium]
MEETNNIVGVKENFLSQPGEELLIVKREHWFVVAVSLIFCIFFGLVFSAVSFFALLFYTWHPTLFILSILTTIILTLSLTTKSVIDWYCHLYIVTSRKILEVCYIPLFSHVINGVFLDQVRCTEIDVKTKGILSEFIDMGDVVITFDRPTHQEEFVFYNIKDPRGTGIFLGDSLHSTEKNVSLPIWYREREKNKFRFIEQLFPKHSLGSV